MRQLTCQLNYLSLCRIPRIVNVIQTKQKNIKITPDIPTDVWISKNRLGGGGPLLYFIIVVQIYNICVVGFPKSYKMLKSNDWK